jgi:hypothetical protein
MNCIHCTVFKKYICSFELRTTVRTLYTYGTYHRQDPVHLWYVPPSEPCTLHGTYHRQNPVHFKCFVVCWQFAKACNVCRSACNHLFPVCVQFLCAELLSVVACIL